MRLSQNEVNIIKTCILEHIRDARIILFGSRLYDYKKGGDIDIFIETVQAVSLKEQIKILTNIELSGVLRKVDLVLKMPNTKDQSIFKTIINEGIVL
jgi:predicted nucleotidyltransferase